MALISTLESLKIEQLRSIAEIRFSSEEIKYKSDKSLIYKIYYEFFIGFTKQQIQREYIDELDIIYLWCNLVLEILNNKKISLNHEKNKHLIIEEIKAIRKCNYDLLDYKLEAISRNILKLLFDSLDENEKDQFVAIIKTDLESQNITLTQDELNKNVIGNIIGGTSTLSLLVIPIISNIILQRLTQGFLTWVLMTFFGQLPVGYGILAFMAGPIGLGIAGALSLLSLGWAVMNYKDTQQKIHFIQMFFAIYSYSYQNKIKRRFL